MPLIILSMPLIILSIPLIILSMPLIELPMPIIILSMPLIILSMPLIILPIPLIELSMPLIELLTYLRLFSHPQYRPLDKLQHLWVFIEIICMSHCRLKDSSLFYLSAPHQWVLPIHGAASVRGFIYFYQ